MTDVVVIGAGIGGLSAAIQLAASGLEVEVVEASDTPGGKAGVATVDGVRFDTGPSLLTMPDVFETLLQLAGTSLAHELTLRKPDPCFRYLYPDGVVLDVFHELDATVASVRATLGARAAKELTDFMAYARRIWEAAAPAFVYGPAPSFKSLLFQGLSGMAAAARVDPLRSMRGAIDGRVRDPHLRHLLWRYATYNGSDVRRAPATLNCIAHVELALGGFGIEGGLHALVEAMVRVAARVGVRLTLGARVKRVVIDDGRVAGVELAGGRTLRAPQVVSNADVAHLVVDLLEPDVPHGLPRDAEPSMSGFNAVVRARRRAGSKRRVAHTVLFPDDYEAEFEDVFDRGRAPRQPTVYACAQEVCHGVKGWADHEPVFLMTNAPPHMPEQRDDGFDAEAVALEELRRASLIDRDDEVVWRRTPADLARLFPGSYGAIYGPSSNNRTAAFRRAPNEVAGLPGLFIASGSAHPGGGVPMAALSGQAAARALLDVRGLAPRLEVAS